MTAATKQAHTIPHESGSALTKGRTVVTGLGGAAALGLITIAAVPTLPLLAAGAALVGLAGGVVAALRDTSQGTRSER